MSQYIADVSVSRNLVGDAAKISGNAEIQVELEGINHEAPEKMAEA